MVTSVMHADSDKGNLNDAEVAASQKRLRLWQASLSNQIAALKTPERLTLTSVEARWLLHHIGRWEYPPDLQREVAQVGQVSEYMPFLSFIRHVLEEALQRLPGTAEHDQMDVSVEVVLPNAIANHLIDCLSDARMAADEDRIWYPCPVLGSVEDVTFAQLLADKLQTILLDPWRPVSTPISSPSLSPGVSQFGVDDTSEGAVLPPRVQSEITARAWKLALAQVLGLS